MIISYKMKCICVSSGLCIVQSLCAIQDASSKNQVILIMFLSLYYNTTYII